MPGKIISAILTAKSANCCSCVDEVDKMASDFRGDPAAAPAGSVGPGAERRVQGSLSDILFDLSDVLFITTANTMDTIPASAAGPYGCY